MPIIKVMSGVFPGHRQRHEQQPRHQQAPSHPSAGGSSQPVWLPHREGRIKDQRDERSTPALHAKLLTPDLPIQHVR